MAQRTNFSDTIIDSEGNALSNIKVTVVRSGDDPDSPSSPISIYSGKNSGAKANNFNTGSNGEVDFWCDPGSYDVYYRDNNLVRNWGPRIIGFEAVSGDVVNKGISPKQIDWLDVDSNSQVGIYNMKIATDYKNFSTIGSGAKTFETVSNIAPGIYIIQGGGSDDTGVPLENLRFEKTGGSGNVTINGGTPAYANYTSAILIVTTNTVDVALKGTVPAAFSIQGGITLFGFKI